MNTIQTITVSASLAFFLSLSSANASEAPLKFKGYLGVSKSHLTGPNAQPLPEPQVEEFEMTTTYVPETEAEAAHHLGEFRKSEILPDGRTAKIYGSYRQYDGTNWGMIAVTAAVQGEFGGTMMTNCSGSSYESMKLRQKSAAVTVTTGCRGADGGLTVINIDFSLTRQKKR